MYILQDFMAFYFHPRNVLKRHYAITRRTVRFMPKYMTFCKSPFCWLQYSSPVHGLRTQSGAVRGRVFVPRILWPFVFARTNFNYRLKKPCGARWHGWHGVQRRWVLSVTGTHDPTTDAATGVRNPIKSSHSKR